MIGAAGTNPKTISSYIVEEFPNIDVVTIPGGVFFSLDAERHFPNFATLVTTDEFEDPSRTSTLDS
jgi:hypothetical protein